jgi:lipoprotein-anchoring transpeptidase ErfK/SrfK
MGARPFRSLLKLAGACVLLPTVVAAQYAPYPYGFSPGTSPYRAQPGYMEDPDDLYYTPRARSRPQRMQPFRDNRYFPSDADPDYSSAGASDEDVDFNETTRTTVVDPTGQSAGTITIDTARRKLYLSVGNGRALEYGIGVGRQGFAWKGEARVGRKAYWPGWTPPREMLARRPDLPSHMEGGLENPLGARALYLFQGNRDTLFRIHGTNEPDTIGKAVSSGCIRMLNADVIDLYQRVSKNARVIVI